MLYITKDWDSELYFPCDSTGRIITRTFKTSGIESWLLLAEAWRCNLYEIEKGKRILVGRGGAGGGLVIMNAKPIEITEPPEDDHESD